MNNEVGGVNAADFLPTARADGRDGAPPEDFGVETGLAAVQVGFDARMNGVVTRNVAISL